MLWFKSLWLLIVIFNIISLIYMVIGVEKYFQGNFPLPWIFIAFIISIPSIILVGISFGGIFLKKEGAKGMGGYLVGIIIIISLLFLTKFYFTW